MILWTESDGQYKTRIRVSSDMSGKKYDYIIKMPHKEFTEALRKWKDGQLIQVAFPNLPAHEREIIKTGISPEEWESLGGDE